MPKAPVDLRAASDQDVVALAREGREAAYRELIPAADSFTHPQ